MRANVIITLFLVLGIFNSCQKELEDPGSYSSDPAANFKAKIDGIQFVAGTSGAAIRADSIISVSGKSNDGQIIVITVIDSGVHIYSLNFNSTTNVGGYIDSSGVAFNSNGGSNSQESGGKLTIISIDRLNRFLSGTFNFKAYSQADQKQIIITEGVIENVKYWFSQSKICNYYSKTKSCKQKVLQLFYYSKDIFYLYKFSNSLFICVTDAAVSSSEFENKVFASSSFP